MYAGGIGEKVHILRLEVMRQCTYLRPMVVLGLVEWEDSRNGWRDIFSRRMGYLIDAAWWRNHRSILPILDVGPMEGDKRLTWPSAILRKNEIRAVSVTILSLST
jgi:hypothetical protein